MEVEEATDTKEDKGSTGEEGKCFQRLLVALSAALFYTLYDVSSNFKLGLTSKCR